MTGRRKALQEVMAPVMDLLPPEYLRSLARKQWAAETDQAESGRASGRARSTEARLRRQALAEIVARRPAADAETLRRLLNDAGFQCSTRTVYLDLRALRATPRKTR